MIPHAMLWLALCASQGWMIEGASPVAGVTTISLLAPVPPLVATDATSGTPDAAGPRASPPLLPVSSLGSAHSASAQGPHAVTRSQFARWLGARGL